MYSIPKGIGTQTVGTTGFYIFLFYNIGLSTHFHTQLGGDSFIIKSKTFLENDKVVRGIPWIAN